MADIELVIKIDKEDYEKVLEINNRDCESYWNTVHRCYESVLNGVLLPKGHGRLIDADALADKLQEVSVLQRYEEVKIDHRCTVADVLTSLTHDLKGTALLGYELCPTIIEADKEDTE